MISSALKDAQRMTSHSAEDLTEQWESWQRDHDWARACRDVEVRLILVMALIRASLKLEAKWRSSSPHSEPGADPGTEGVIRRAFLRISSSCSQINEVVAWLESHSCAVESAAEFRDLWRRLDEVVRRLEEPAAPTVGVFEGALTTWIASPRPNPRPVQVDQHGRILEMTGEPIVAPGLEPEAVLRGFADFEAGRVRPLKEIIARRTNGLRDPLDE
jgi:hypothetical protein